MGKKNGFVSKKKPGKTIQQYKSLNKAYSIDNFQINTTEHYSSHSKNIGNLEWTNKEPINYFNFLVDMYGIPDVLGNTHGGIAIWNKSLKNQTDKLTGLPNIYEKIEIKDEQVLHRCPSDHIDFVYSYLKIPILPNQLKDIVRLSGSVNYDMLKHELFARCGSLEANIATLYMCTHIVLSHYDNNKYMSIDYIHNNDEYANHIKSTINPEFVKQMYVELIDNIRLINEYNTLPVDYWPGAFNKNCGKPI